MSTPDSAPHRTIFTSSAPLTSDTEEFSQQDQARPIVLIDGPGLTQLCIDHKVGFLFRPAFDSETLRSQLTQIAKHTGCEDETRNEPDAMSSRNYLKTITANDIRSRIISVPADLAASITAGTETLTVTFPPHFLARQYQYQPARKYIAGITDVLRAFGLLGSAGERYPRLAEWVVAQGSRSITVFIKADEDAPIGHISLASPC